VRWAGIVFSSSISRQLRCLMCNVSGKVDSFDSASELLDLVAELRDQTQAPKIKMTGSEQRKSNRGLVGR